MTSSAQNEVSQILSSGAGAGLVQLRPNSGGAKLLPPLDSEDDHHTDYYHDEDENAGSSKKKSKHGSKKHAHANFVPFEKTPFWFIGEVPSPFLDLSTLVFDFVAHCATLRENPQESQHT